MSSASFQKFNPEACAPSYEFWKILFLEGCEPRRPDFRVRDLVPRDDSFRALTVRGSELTFPE